MASIVVPYENVRQAFAGNPNAINEKVDQAATAAARGDPAARARMIAQWHDAMAALAAADQGATVLSTPQNDLASRLQTMLVNRAVEADQVQTVLPKATVTTDAGDSEAEATVQVKFDNNDLLGWLGTGLEILFTPEKHPWLPPPETPERIPNDAKIALFSDWGTGLYGAPVITKTIGALPRCDVAVHLGDTYYSGDEDEIKDRLIGGWPKRANTLNRALNGNHEMYSGGQGYFEALASFFKQSSSCIALQNTNWLILGMDTAYVDFDLDPIQVDWVKRMIAGAGTRRVILLSHHQPFSALDDQGPLLQAKLLEVLESGR